MSAIKAAGEVNAEKVWTKAPNEKSGNSKGSKKSEKDGSIFGIIQTQTLPSPKDSKSKDSKKSSVNSDSISSENTNSKDTNDSISSKKIPGADEITSEVLSFETSKQVVTDITNGKDDKKIKSSANTDSTSAESTNSKDVSNSSSNKNISGTDSVTSEVLSFGASKQVATDISNVNDDKKTKSLANTDSTSAENTNSKDVNDSNSIKNISGTEGVTSEVLSFGVSKQVTTDITNVNDDKKIKSSANADSTSAENTNSKDVNDSNSIKNISGTGGVTSEVLSFGVSKQVTTDIADVNDDKKTKSSANTDLTSAESINSKDVNNSNSSDVVKKSDLHTSNSKANDLSKVIGTSDISSTNKDQVSNDTGKSENKSKDSISSYKINTNQTGQIQNGISDVIIQSYDKQPIQSDKVQSSDQNTTVTGNEKGMASSNVETTVKTLQSSLGNNQFGDMNSNQNFQNVIVKITNIIKQTPFDANQIANSATLSQMEDQKKQGDLKNYTDLPQVSRELGQTNIATKTEIKSDDSNQTVFSTKITNTIIKAAQEQQTPVKVEIQLNPPSLGKVEIQLTEDGGQTSLILNSDNQKTQELLKNAVPVILDKLYGLNFNVVNVQINGQEWYQNNSNGDDKQKGDENNRKKKEENSQESFGQMFKKEV